MLSRVWFFVCRILQVPSENMDHLPEPAIELWHKVVPLGMIFFCASFNLTILQVGSLARILAHTIQLFWDYAASSLAGLAQTSTAVQHPWGTVLRLRPQQWFVLT
jgi:hypothetical protein